MNNTELKKLIEEYVCDDEILDEIYILEGD